MTLINALFVILACLAGGRALVRHIREAGATAVPVAEAVKDVDVIRDWKDLLASAERRRGPSARTSSPRRRS